MTNKVFNNYDPLAPFPQPARLGLGNVDRNGVHTPPSGFTGHEVSSVLIHGPDNEFYDTTSPGTLTPKSQGDVDAIKAARAAAKEAERAADAANRAKIAADKGQGGGLPEINERIDDLVELLQTLNIIPR